MYFSGDLNKVHVNSKILLVPYSDVQYSNGCEVFKLPFRSPFESGPFFKRWTEYWTKFSGVLKSQTIHILVH